MSKQSIEAESEGKLVEVISSLVSGMQRETVIGPTQLKDFFNEVNEAKSKDKKFSQHRIETLVNEIVDLFSVTTHSMEQVPTKEHSWYTTDNGMAVECDECGAYAHMYDSSYDFQEVIDKKDCKGGD